MDAPPLRRQEMYKNDLQDYRSGYPEGQDSLIMAAIDCGLTPRQFYGIHLEIDQSQQRKYFKLRRVKEYLTKNKIDEKPLRRRALDVIASYGGTPLFVPVDEFYLVYIINTCVAFTNNEQPWLERGDNYVRDTFLEMVLFEKWAQSGRTEQDIEGDCKGLWERWNNRAKEILSFAPELGHGAGIRIIVESIW
jgi:hypothetical protein